MVMDEILIIALNYKTIKNINLIKRNVFDVQKKELKSYIISVHFKIQKPSSVYVM